MSDDERNRYGVLLDHAAERGLLSPTEYRVRMGELADAPSVEVLQRIVTELPAFDPSGTPTAAPVRSFRPELPSAAYVPDPGALDSTLWANRTAETSRRSSGHSWLVLAVLIVVLLVAMVTLALVAAHIAHTHHAALAAGVDLISPLRL